ncbi:MAG: CehA/McbA family metallohydrolase [Treponema sp.]|jgi:hypothetical protein|nr:CehA/McbA family metallohydrolase [Treponema sp.]
MQEIRFDQSYTRDNARTYIKLPFDMPDGIERIELEYEYPRFVEEILPEGRHLREVNIIDLGVYDQKGCLYGWSGSQRRSIFITNTAASPGYKHGNLVRGKWAVALGLYRIEGTVRVTVLLRLYPKERKMYRGDLHIHTVNSDGSYTTAFVLQSCEKAGLDFIALTDHNNMKQNSEIGNPEHLTVIPGVEYTNYAGHANFFFTDPAARFNDDFLSNSFKEMAAVFRRAKEAGAFISLNHPFSLCPWEFGYDNFPFDLIEVWNGPMSADNMQAVACWHQFLCQGKKLAAVAGSDMHRYELGRTFGSPCTFVYADGGSVTDILNAVSRGRSGMAYTPDGPFVDISIGGFALGDTVPFRPGLEGQVVLLGAKTGDILKLINCKGLAETYTAPFDGVYRHSFSVKDLSFYRLEVYRKLLDQMVLSALSNPVYIQGI